MGYDSSELNKNTWHGEGIRSQVKGHRWVSNPCTRCVGLFTLIQIQTTRQHRQREWNPALKCSNDAIEYWRLCRVGSAIGRPFAPPGRAGLFPRRHRSITTNAKVLETRSLARLNAHICKNCEDIAPAMVVKHLEILKLVPQLLLTMP